MSILLKPHCMSEQEHLNLLESENILEHNMHSERFEVRLEQVKSLMAHSAPRFAVGTTSLRVLESLYLIGSKIKTR